MLPLKKTHTVTFHHLTQQELFLEDGTCHHAYTFCCRDLGTPVLWMKSSLEPLRFQDNWLLINLRSSSHNNSELAKFYKGFLKTCKLFAVATREDLLAESLLHFPPLSSVEASPLCRTVLKDTTETGDLISPTLLTVQSSQGVHCLSRVGRLPCIPQSLSILSMWAGAPCSSLSPGSAVLRLLLVTSQHTTHVGSMSSLWPRNASLRNATTHLLLILCASLPLCVITTGGCRAYWASLCSDSVSDAAR